MGNRDMHRAKKNKNDEFYTQINDIEKEVLKYKDQFKDKVVYLNCDDPMYKNIDGEMEIHKDGSHFWNFFYLQFERLGLKKLISTHYSEEDPTYKLEYTGGGIENVVKTNLKQNGDFRSDESIECLKEADIVCTNPPFSLFREYVAQLIEYNKKFLIMGNNNAITYKEIFPLIKENKMWLGYHANKTVEFKLPNHYEKWNRIDEDTTKYGKVPAISWFTNMDLEKRHEDILLYKDYYGSEENYPKYDNYDAIEVNKVKDIPRDYEGVMDVPITFLTKYNPKQFQIIKFRKGEDNKDLSINGRTPYFRILIKNKNPKLKKENKMELLFNNDKKREIKNE